MKPSSSLSLLLALALGSPSLWAKAHLLSPLPLPHQEAINIETEPCDEACLYRLDKEEKVFSFIARFHPGITSEALRARLAILMEENDIHAAPFYMVKKSRSKLEIALLVPKKSIGRYSVTTIDTILAYLVSKEGAFSFEVFDSQDESATSLAKAIQKVESKGFDYAIALVTHQGASELVKLSLKIPLYIPSVHQKQVLQAGTPPKNIFFGGIDYEAQIRALLPYAKGSTVSLYNDDSYIGQKIGEYVKLAGAQVGFEESFSNTKAAEFNKGVKSQGRFIQGSSVFLNTPIVKSSLILSQFTYNGYKPSDILSTQINYNHSLLSLTQPKDRENLYIANSIGEASREIIEYSAILKSDLQYDWINYSTSLGVEYFYRTVFPEAIPYFNEKLEGNQVNYPIRLYQTKPDRFIPIN
ncbi:hypothetical protein [Wolinella succinogenes]|uniref:Periplasmic protein n=1 Tax=Wolinella succinogenes (strain ATCC 29543 / DSM 1740 / CCUG 13145 / JCM 31913 / LMG 7466 / NCTC 11488 / FDC 602W) TaxID=273121 RepID=Q7MRL8_WOLSU|nr:hypothetical protein [Wolinella succinogenes]CAE10315.1 conserved hypothetical protein [Wolinella succinogenes]VEG80323.1 Uncharacterised protein [Wolinella succinogenes]HCZ19737.1 hypothetical protein [Helicobacter sp.]